MPGAPTEFTVAGVTGVSDEPWGDNKDMLTTTVLFAGDEREWKIFHNVAWPVVIEQGATLKGWKNFDKGTFGLAKDHKGDAPSGGSRGGGSRKAGGDGPGLTWASKPYERGAEHPRNEARMIHTSALSAAPAFVEQMLTVGVAAQPKDEDAYWALVGHVAGKLTKTYQRVLGGVAPPPPPAQATLNGGEVPADTAGLEPVAVPASDGDDLPF